MSNIADKLKTTLGRKEKKTKYIIFPVIYVRSSSNDLVVNNCLEHLYC